MIKPAGTERSSSSSSTHTYLLDYTAFTHARSTPGYEPSGDGQYLRPYPANKLRPHATRSHMYRFDPIALHHAGDNVRSLMNRNDNETGFQTSWTAVNCVPEWNSVVGTINTPMSVWGPDGDFAVEMVVSALGDASLSQTVANNNGLNAAKVYSASVYIRLADGVTAPANGAQLIASTNAGATTVTKNITPTSSWVRHSINITCAAAPNNKIVLTLKLPNAAAGDRVIWALPELIGDGANRDLSWAPMPHKYINLGSTHVKADGDSLTIPAASVPSRMLGAGGAFAFTWIPEFDSTSTTDVTFFSCGDLYREILWAPARDGSIWVRADNSQISADPKVKSQVLSFVAGDVIEVFISPTLGKIYVTGCSGGGNGLGPATWAAGNGFNAGGAVPYTWASNDMIVGDRYPAFGYVRGSHMGCGYLSEPYETSFL